MIVGQTLFSVKKGTEHRAEAALAELEGYLHHAAGLRTHRILRSFGMSPIGSDLHREARAAELGELHYVVQTEWDTMETHDEFYRSGAVGRVYAVLSSVITSGPYEVLYRALEQDDRSRVAV